MGPTTSEREALLRECYEWLFESKTDGPRVSEGAIAKGYYTEAFAEFHNRLQAALTRQEAQQGNSAFLRERAQLDAEWVALRDLQRATQQEAQGAVASTIDAGGFISDTAALAFLRVIGGGNPNVEYAVERLRLSLITPPAPVDVRVALPKVTFKNVQRGDCGKYPDGTGWGHAWSAPIVEIERADWDRFIALLSGQPAGVCVYPDCNCPFDAPADPNWCARGLPKAALGGGGGGE